MITLDDILNSINSILRDKTFTLVLHRSMIEHPKFKVYKIFGYNLYMVNIKDKSKNLVLEHSYTINTPSDSMIETWNKCDKDFVTELIKWCTTKEFTEWI